MGSSNMRISENLNNLLKMGKIVQFPQSKIQISIIFFYSPNNGVFDSGKTLGILVCVWHPKIGETRLTSVTSAFGQKLPKMSFGAFFGTFTLSSACCVLQALVRKFVAANVIYYVWLFSKIKINISGPIEKKLCYLKIGVNINLPVQGAYYVQILLN